MRQLAFMEKKRKPVELNRSRVTIGRDKSNSLVLTDEGISGFHAEIHMDEGNIFIMDLGSTNGTKVNGEKITTRLPVKVWDVIEFDKVKLEIVDPTKRRPTVEREAVKKSALENAWALQGISGTMAGKNFPISKAMIVGREDCDIIIDNAMISSRHAKLELDDQILNVKDLGSTNGTFVNGKQITEAILKAGDEIKFDKMVFTVKGPDRPSAKTAVRTAFNLAKTQVRNSVAAKTQVKPAQDHSAPSQALLEVVKGHNGRQAFDLKGSSLTIGRLAENDIVLTDEMVSGCHAQLTCAGGIWSVEDKDSANGTLINNVKVTRQALKPGDRLSIGQVELCFKDPNFKEPVGSTKVMASPMPYEPEEDFSAPSKKKVPVWIYGIIGFCIAGGVLAFLL